MSVRGLLIHSNNTGISDYSMEFNRGAPSELIFTDASYLASLLNMGCNVCTIH